SPRKSTGNARPTERMRFRRGSGELVDRARPALVQEPRQCAIGEDDAAGLAARAVVAFVLGIDDALHRHAADRTWLAEAAVDGHLRPKCRDSLRECAAGLHAQTLDPFAENGASRGEESRDLRNV